MKTLLRGICTGTIVAFWNGFSLFVLVSLAGLSVWQYTWVNTALLPFLAGHLVYALVPLVLFVTSAIAIGRFTEELEDYQGLDPRNWIFAIFISLIALAFYIWAIVSHVSITITLPN